MLFPWQGPTVVTNYGSGADLQTESLKSKAIESKRDILEADLALKKVSDITPQRLKKLGVQGAIFDLDDTLLPMNSDTFSRETIRTLKKLKRAGIEIGIVSNNPMDSRTKHAKAELAEEGLDIPFIKDGTKPVTDDFIAMAEQLHLPPDRIVMVGDSYISDIAGGNAAGMKTIHAEWYQTNGWHQLFGVIRDVCTSAVSFIRELFQLNKPSQFLVD